MNHSKNSKACAGLTVADAVSRVPTADGKRFATIFQHGTLLVEIYAPRGIDPQQPHTRDEIYFVATGSGEYFAATQAQRSAQPIYSSLPLGSSTGLKTLPTTWSFGFSFMVRKVARLA